MFSLMQFHYSVALKVFGLLSQTWMQNIKLKKKNSQKEIDDVSSWYQLGKSDIQTFLM